MCQGLLREFICEEQAQCPPSPKDCRGNWLTLSEGPEDGVGNNILRPGVLTEKIFAILLSGKSSLGHMG